MCQLNGVLGPHLSPSVTEVPFVVLLQIGQHIRMYCFGIGVCSLSLGFCLSRLFLGLSCCSISALKEDITN